ncbi:DUF2163 domain-containing protein [Microbaculum marinum]|uniref:DUF2163 domain-containing protein n=1 Tax=Microbaculum marinum TaxID=1764581 RepID=A0AAW9RZU9_9HYPH
MKSLSPLLQAHLAGPVTTLCWCWKVVRTDTTVLGFTDHDRAVAVDGTTYEAATGFVATEIDSSLGLSVDTLDVEGALSSSAIGEADLRAGLYDGAAIEVWRVNWADPDQRVLMRAGTIGEVRRGELAFTAELRGLAQALDQALGRTYRRTCDADLGDARCAVDLDDPAFKATATVVSCIDDRVLTVAAFAEGDFAPGWFRHGRLTWTGGANAGQSVEVREHTVEAAGIVLTQWQQAAFTIEPGDTFTVTAGCDKTFATCRTKFANRANFRGFPHMPGNDRAFSYVVGDSGENDGGSFFS